MKRFSRWKAVGLLTACAVLAGIAVAGLQGCGGSSVSGPGNFSGGSLSITAFTVSPATGKPGQTVTLKGLQLDDSTPVTINFGGQEAVITQRGTGDTQVMVPVFLVNGALKTPIAPVSVTATATGAGTVAGNTFTVQDLPAAPGTTAAITAQLDNIGSFLDSMTRQGLLPLTTGANAPFDRNQIIQAVALAACFDEAIDGADNPDSLKNILNGTSPDLQGAKLPPDVLDALLAQTNALSQLSAITSELAAIVNGVAPGTATNALTRGNTGRAFLNINWVSLTAAQRLLVNLEVAQDINNLSSKVQIIEPIAGLFAGTTSLVLSCIPTPQTQAAARLLDLGALSLGIASKVLTAIVALTPSQIAEYYVIISGTHRKDKAPPLTMTVGQTLPLDCYVGTQSPGGDVISPAGIAQYAVTFIFKKLPKRFHTNDAATNHARQVLYDHLFGTYANVIDSVWTNIAGSPPPDSYFHSGTISVPPGKEMPVLINDSGIVTVTSRSPAVLAIPSTPNNNGSYTMSALAPSSASGGGFEAKIANKVIVPGLPTLVQVCKASMVDSDITGVVIVNCGQTKDSCSNLPPGCVACGKGTSCDYDANHNYIGGCGVNNSYQGCCSDYPCSPQCVD